jgi:competence protein ComEA
MFTRVSAFAVVALALTAAPRNVASGNQTPPKDRGRELVEDVCTYCHNLDRLQGQQLSREEWRGVIKGMISEGAPVTDQEFSMILDYLTKNYGKRSPQEPR